MAAFLAKKREIFLVQVLQTCKRCVNDLGR